MKPMKPVQRVVRGARRRLRASPLADAVLDRDARRRARRLAFADPTLAAVAEAITTPSGREQAWGERIERRRRELEASTGTVAIEIRDQADREYWAEAIPKSTDRTPPLIEGDVVRRDFGEFARTTGKPPQWGRLFYRLVRRLQPAGVLELGTSVGMSACYLAAGLEDNAAGLLVTIDALPDVADAARKSFEQLGVTAHADCRTGLFVDEMPAAFDALGTVDLAFIDGHHQYEPTVRYFGEIADVSSSGALLAFDDISPYHPGMSDAWHEICADRRVTGTLRIDTVGLAVVGGRRAGHAHLPRLALG